MLYSKSFIYTLREDPKIAECPSHKLLLKGCFLCMISSGIYSYLPLGKRVLDKVSAIIRKHMDRAGAQELLMSALQPIELWEKTGRDKTLEEVMFKFKDRKNRMLCLGPTHEEEVTDIARKFVTSYRQLPFTLYQIQTKFRDEPRPRFGLVRSAEFIMKDAYSFDTSEQGLAAMYARMREAYQAIFNECGLNFVMVGADSGAMGGSVSHEFMVPAPIGEDVLYQCVACNDYAKEQAPCGKCGANRQEVKMIEIGHIFQLGTKYTAALDACYLDEKSARVPIIMGCYGIGVSRLLPSIVETNYDDKGIMWPKSVAPYDISFVVVGEKLLSEAKEIVEQIEKQGYSVLFDDRNEGAGVKFNDAYLIGNPYVVIMGKNFVSTKKLDVEVRRTKEKVSLSLEELINFINKEYAR